MLKWLFLLILLALAVIFSLIPICRGESWESFMLNLATELFGAIIIYFLFDIIISGKEKRELNRQILLENLHSSNNFLRESSFKKLLKQEKHRIFNINNINVTGIYLKGFIFKETKLNYCNFFGADIENSKILDSYFLNCDLSSVNLDNAEINNSAFDKSNLENTFIRNCTICNSNFTSVSFKNANLSKSKFTLVDFKDVKLLNAVVEDAIFKDSKNLTDSNKNFLLSNGAKVI